MKINIKMVLSFIFGATYPIWLPPIKNFFSSSKNNICVDKEYLMLEHIDRCKAETDKNVESCVDEAWERYCE